MQAGRRAGRGTAMTAIGTKRTLRFVLFKWGHLTLTTPPHPHGIVSAGFSHVPQYRSGAFMAQHFEALVLPDGMRAVPVFIGTFLCVLYAGMV